MKFRNKILVMLLTMTLASQGLAWDDGKKKEEDNKRKYIIAGLVTVGVAVAAVVGFKAWNYFDVGSMLKKKSSVDAEEFIGIDLGTTKSGGGRGDELIADAEGKTMTASAVAYDKDGKVLSTGSEALEADNRVTSAKRIIGMPLRKANDEKNLNIVADTRKDMEHMAAIKTAEGHSVTPEEAATEVLQGVKQRIDAHYGKDFKKAVITVPAYFYEFQKAATKRAAKAAGFDEVVLINEPTAAAFAHGTAELDTKAFKKGVNYLVYDFGGGTMDISIVKAFFEKKTGKTFKVNSITGDSLLGGDDIDAKIAEKFAQDLGLDFDKADDATKHVLRQQAEHAKIHLSDVNNKAYQSGDFKLSDQDVQVEISIDDFNTEIEEIVDKTIKETKEALDIHQGGGISVEDIDEVILVGGSSRNLLVREKLIDLFGEDKLAKSLQGEIDPDEMVAKGAAKYAKALDTNEDYTLSDIVPMALRVDLRDSDTGKKMSVAVIKRFDGQPAAGEVDAVIKHNASEDNPLDIYVRQGDFDEYDKNLVIGVPKFKGDLSIGDEVYIMFKFDQDGILDITIRKKADNTLIKSDGIDMSKTPKNIEEVVEEGAENQLTKLLQAAGMQSQEIVEVLGKIAKGQEEVRELLKKCSKITS